MDSKEFLAWAGNRAGGNSFSGEVGAYKASGSASLASLWGRTGSFQLITAGIQMAVVSGSVADALAGTGARTVIVTMIDVNWNEVTETINLNGTTRVACTATNIIALKRMDVVATGSGRQNAGELRLVDNAAGTTTYGTVNVGQNSSISSMAWWPIMAGNCAIIKSLFVKNLTTPGNRALIRLNVWHQEYTGSYINTVGLMYDANVDRPFPCGLFVPEKSIIYADHLVQTGGNEITGGFSIFETAFN